jgi:quercetin dioxygenase-like cupin family protein
MTRTASFAAAATAALLLAAAAGPAAAATAPVLAHDLPNAPGMRMTAITVSYGPGETSASHRHAEHGFLMAYVLKGSIVSQLEGEPERTYATGQSWTEGPNAHHLVSRNASRTEPAEILVVFVAPANETLTTVDPH